MITLGSKRANAVHYQILKQVLLWSPNVVVGLPYARPKYLAFPTT